MGFSGSEKIFKKIFFDFELGFLKSGFFGQALNKQTTAQPDKGWDYSPRDRMAGVKAAVGNKRSQCAGLFSAIHLAGKNRHNPPIWCSGDGAKKLDIINSAANFHHEMPAPKDIILQIFNKDEDSRFYLTHFMQQFNAAHNESAVIESATGHKLLVSDKLFTDHKTGKLKINKMDRSKYALYIADTIKNPDEIWIKSGDYDDRALYLLSRYTFKKDIINVLAVFKETGKVWTGWTGYQTIDADYFNTKREGVLIYRR